MVDAGGSASSGLTDAMDASDTVRDFRVVALGLVRLVAAGNAERCVVEDLIAASRAAREAMGLCQRDARSQATMIAPAVEKYASELME